MSSHPPAMCRCTVGNVKLMLATPYISAGTDSSILSDSIMYRPLDTRRSPLAMIKDANLPLIATSGVTGLSSSQIDLTYTWIESR